MVASFVWRFARKENSVAICNLCNKRIALSAGSTSGLKSHLKSQHQIDENSVPASNSATKQMKIEDHASVIPVSNSMIKVNF